MEEKTEVRYNIIEDQVFMTIEKSFKDINGVFHIYERETRPIKEDASRTLLRLQENRIKVEEELDQKKQRELQILDGAINSIQNQIPRREQQ